MRKPYTRRKEEKVVELPSLRLVKNRKVKPTVDDAIRLVRLSVESVLSSMKESK
jgi:hypothetical protein